MATSPPEVRRHHLAALAHELQAHGLHHRLMGNGEDVLRVTNPSTGRGAMALAVPSSTEEWCYLWSGGGLADTTDPSHAAAQIADLLK